MNTNSVKYTDADMRMMCYGEIGAQIMGVMLAVASWLYLGELSAFIKAPVVIVVLLLSAYLGLAFIHLGYNPDEQEGQQPMP